MALLSILFFNLSFVALGYNYVPTEELLDKEEEESAAIADEETENGGASLESSNGQYAEPIGDKENLQSIDFSGCQFSGVTATFLFYGCPNLKEIKAIGCNQYTLDKLKSAIVPRVYTPRQKGV